LYQSNLLHAPVRETIPTTIGARIGDHGGAGGTKADRPAFHPATSMAGKQIRASASADNHQHHVGSCPILLIPSNVSVIGLRNRPMMNVAVQAILARGVVTSVLQ